MKGETIKTFIENAISRVPNSPPPPTNRKRRVIMKTDKAVFFSNELIFSCTDYVNICFMLVNINKSMFYYNFLCFIYYFTGENGEVFWYLY